MGATIDLSDGAKNNKSMLYQSNCLINTIHVNEALIRSKELHHVTYGACNHLSNWTENLSSRRHQTLQKKLSYS